MPRAAAASIRARPRAWNAIAKTLPIARWAPTRARRNRRIDRSWRASSAPAMPSQSAGYAQRRTASGIEAPVPTTHPLRLTPVRGSRRSGRGVAAHFRASSRVVALIATSLVAGGLLRERAAARTRCAPNGHARSPHRGPPVGAQRRAHSRHAAADRRDRAGDALPARRQSSGLRRRGRLLVCHRRLLRRQERGRLVAAGRGARPHRPDALHRPRPQARRGSRDRRDRGELSTAART